MASDDPENYRGSERRKKLVVVDRPTEVGVKLNNVLTALVLMVMSWVGWNIDQMKNQISDVISSQRVQENELQHLEGRYERHLERYHGE